MNKPNLNVVAYALTIAALFAALLYIYSKNRALLSKNDLLVEQSVNSKNKNDSISFMTLTTLQANMKHMLKNNGLSLQNFELKSINGDNVSLEAIVGNDEKLIVRISSLFCNTCNEYLLLELLHNKDKIGIDNIIVIGTFENVNSMKILRDNLKIPFQIYSTLDNNTFKYLPIESESFPYCFIIDRTRKIQHVFLPNKAVPDISEKYFDAIAIRFF
jgi:peroxiredoxin